jgi:hypothetical protein
MMTDRLTVAGFGAVVCALLSAPATAQCRPPASSHEARLLAFYEAPTAFSVAGAPARLAAGAISIGAEVIPVPSPAPALQRPEYCYANTTTNTRLAPVFGRPRLALGLPAGIVLEASYLPTIVVAGAEATLTSVALSRTHDVSAGHSHLVLLLRAHATAGRIRGAITCPANRLQLDDAGAPCYGRRPSRDTFRPDALGIETALGVGSHGGRLAAYVGGGMSWLRPRFETGFVDARDNVDRTVIAAALARGTAFAGATARLRGPLALSVQLYSVPADVTTIRAAAEYRIR